MQRPSLLRQLQIFDWTKEISTGALLKDSEVAGRDTKSTFATQSYHFGLVKKSFQGFSITIDCD
jgi:hypothetical protein